MIRKVMLHLISIILTQQNAVIPLTVPSVSHAAYVKSMGAYEQKVMLHLISMLLT